MRSDRTARPAGDHQQQKTSGQHFRKYSVRCCHFKSHVGTRVHLYTTSSSSQSITFSPPRVHFSQVNKLVGKQTKNRNSQHTDFRNMKPLVDEEGGDRDHQLHRGISENSTQVNVCNVLFHTEGTTFRSDLHYRETTYFSLKKKKSH